MRRVGRVGPVILNPLQRVKNPPALSRRETVSGFFALRAQNDKVLAFLQE